jgi:Skp family chaperone for outer membrane proteins
LVLVIVAVGWPVRQATVGQAIEERAIEGEAVPGMPLHAGNPPGVAVVDVKRIFREDAEFKVGFEKLRNELEAYQKQSVIRQTEIASLQQKLQAMKPGSAERDKAQLLLARLQTELNLTNERRQQEFMRREAALYGDTYAKITEAVSRHAKAHGIGLVVRSDQEEIDPNNNKSVLGAVNRIVVYQENLDITDAILEAMNKSEV